MKNRQMQDERVVMQQRKILSEVYIFLMLLLMGSMLVKQFIFNAPFAEYCVEFIGFFGASIYVLVRNLVSGNNLFKTKKSKIEILSIFVSAIIIAVMSTIITSDSIKDLKDLIKPISINLLVALLVMFSIYFILNMVVKKRQKKLESKYDDSSN